MAERKVGIRIFIFESRRASAATSNWTLPLKDLNIGTMVSIEGIKSTSLAIFISLILKSKPVYPPLTESARHTITAFISASNARISKFLKYNVRFFKSTFPHTSSNSTFPNTTFFKSVCNSKSKLPGNTNNFISVGDTVSVTATDTESSDKENEFINWLQSIISEEIAKRAFKVSFLVIARYNPITSPVATISECPIFKEAFLNVIFGPSTVTAVLRTRKGKPNSGVCTNNLSKPTIPRGIHNESFFFSNFALIPATPNANFVSLALKKRESVRMEKLIIGIAEFCSFGASSPVPVVLPLYILSESPIFARNLFISNSHCKVTIFVVSWGLVETTFAFIRSISEANFLLFNIISLISNSACKVSLSLNFKSALPKKLKSLAVSFNSKSFKANLPPNLIRPISCFFKEERRHFKFKPASNLPRMVTFSCKGKVLAKASKSTVDSVWSVISGSINKSSTLASARILVCAPSKWRIFKFKNEGLRRIKSIYDSKSAVKLSIP